MNNSIVIGECPYDEESLQVGKDDPIELKKQAIRFKDAIKKYYSEKMQSLPLDDFTLSVQRNEHDFGVYYDVAAIYNPENEEAMNLAFEIESECPRTWKELEL